MLLWTKFFSPFCPNFMKEGGGPKAEQIVLNFFVPIRGGSMNLGQNPQILLFFFWTRPLSYQEMVRDASVSK